MVRFVSYLKEDWAQRRKIERVLPVLLLTSIIIQIVTVFTTSSLFQTYIAIACLYLNVIVLLSAMLSPIRYINSPLGSIFNTYRVVVDYMPFKKRQHELILQINKLVAEHGGLQEFRRENAIRFSLSFLETHVDILTLMQKNNVAIEAIKEKATI